MQTRLTSAVLTILALAAVAVTGAIGFLLVPAQYQNEKFHLSLGAVILAEVLCWVCCVALPAPRGEQARGMFESGAVLASGIYLVAAIALAFVAMLGFGLKFLIVLHLVAFLVFLAITALFVIGGAAAKKADEQDTSQ